MKEKEINEKELIERISRNDEEAFLHVFNFYHNTILSFIKKYVHSSDLAKDLTQEVFVKIWEKREKLAEVKSFRSYLYTIAKNHTLNTLKKASRSQEVMGEIVEAYFVGNNTTEERLLDKEYLYYLNKALEELPERSKEIFRLCREQKKTYEEVASIMGISKNAVKNHMVFSMKHLRKNIEGELGMSLSILVAIFFN
ncbi:RNA polymerase, sigma-24 subunit, ECF subfamily [Pseudopedobacter saltans DSM 12145]|uniref:RNA polymerase, sigma-24 subunit, ECF subfamily n=1 Tax=Pseudopedobacter saltans (strain ATCC 51119 / DSM 12145 / JCM 21818 / CCUG 39354 / LMG 10337 / NBRC 100064 / NCIMB 13643) TaxID=762903 RepID=F0S5D6_PSESL|nr:RNA polymerase sigma-70 factor [Pseudopedobacter saltans]ADY52081.1 RNA polymerase, sigma-24 subunit, ECF subfamily [Pseudopedobacter saltans DSM 12145]